MRSFGRVLRRTAGVSGSVSFPRLPEAAADGVLVVVRSFTRVLRRRPYSGWPTSGDGHTHASRAMQQEQSKDQQRRHEQP